MVLIASSMELTNSNKLHRDNRMGRDIQIKANAQYTFGVLQDIDTTEIRPEDKPWYKFRKTLSGEYLIENGIATVDDFYRKAPNLPFKTNYEDSFSFTIHQPDGSLKLLHTDMFIVEKKEPTPQITQLNGPPLPAFTGATSHGLTQLHEQQITLLKEQLLFCQEREKSLRSENKRLQNELAEAKSEFQRVDSEYKMYRTQIDMLAKQEERYNDKLDEMATHIQTLNGGSMMDDLVKVTPLITTLVSAFTNKNNTEAPQGMPSQLPTDNATHVPPASQTVVSEQSSEESPESEPTFA